MTTPYDFVKKRPSALFHAIVRGSRLMIFGASATDLLRLGPVKLPKIAKNEGFSVK
jgi:hypothetical protein